MSKNRLGSFFLFSTLTLGLAGPASHSTHAQTAGSVATARAALLQRADRVRLAAQTNVMQLHQEGRYWNLPSYLGRHYISQYYLLRRWLGTQSPSAFDYSYFQNQLAQTQLPDGSWEAIHDESIPHGDLNATLLNYWALKAMGVSIESAQLRRARQFILAQGGVEQSSMFTKLVLALFRNYSWDAVPSIPYALFIESSPLNYHDFGQWIGPHLMPISYLKTMNLSKDLGPQFAVDELWKSPVELRAVRTPEARAQAGLRGVPGISERLLISRMREMQKPHGSWGAYTVSTLLSILALDDFALFYPDQFSQISGQIEKGFRFIEEFYFHSGTGAYLGVLDDGRYWDTALMAIAASESGVEASALTETGNYLVARQGREGGFPFGIDFESYPDTDDTAEIVMFLDRFQGRFQQPIDRATRWLSQMQNDDGGWGAFARNNTGNRLISRIARPFEDSADLFDESSPDVTGHILEAFGTLGYRSQNSETVREAIRYLRQSQEPFGGWFGRWGINYIYGTSAAVVGLIRAGESPTAPYLVRALDWLSARQNEDGGFGESFLSYSRRDFIGRGASTPSQTAWALLALVESGRGAYSAQADRAVEYLVREFERDGKWLDRSTVGTGHPRIIAMNYPSYPYAFTLTALSRYLRAAGVKIQR